MFAISNLNNVTELKRGIRGWQIAFIGLGGVIGSCYFLGLGYVVHAMGPAVFLAFGVVGVIVYGLMISYAELLVNVPRKGSFVAYINEFLGGTAAVACGWTFWFNWVVYVPSEAIAVSIVLNALIPGNMTMYAIGTLAALTIINLTAVDVFAKIESGLAITKVIIIFIFILTALGIWIGLWGSEGFLGSSINFGSGNIGMDIFPNGFGIVLVSMVIVLVTFQGTEIVGLAAAESQNPDVAVPRACKSVTYRIAGLYLVPILLIILVFPYGKATLEDSIFAQVAEYYGMPYALQAIMSGIVLVAAFSCANTGFYGTVRSMYGLSVEGLAPKFLSNLNKRANPKNAVLFTLGGMWVVLMIGLFAAESSVYANLLELSGFTGTIAWVGIILAQLQFRKRLRKNGYNPDECLKAKVKKSQSWIPMFAMIAQIACLIMLAFSVETSITKINGVDADELFADESIVANGMTLEELHDEYLVDEIVNNLTAMGMNVETDSAPIGLIIFIIACLALIIPAVSYVFLKKAGKTRPISTLDKHEKTFEELFPPLNK